MRQVLEECHSGTIQAVCRNLSQHSAILEASRPVGRAAGLGGQRVFDVGIRFAVLVDGLGKIPGPLLGRRDRHVVGRVRDRLSLVFLAPEEKELVFLGVEELGNVDRAADRVSRIVLAQNRNREPLAVVVPVVGVEAVMPVGPVPGRVKLRKCRSWSRR